MEVFNYFVLSFLTNCISNSKSERLFPVSLKRANVTSVRKKNNPLDKENYRPVSTLKAKNLACM